MKKHMCFLKSSGVYVMMNTREIALEYRLSHWSGIMQERNESGLSIRAYCRKIGISTNTYHYWQRKLREAAVTQLSSQKSIQVTNLVPEGWTKAMPVEQEQIYASDAVTVEVGGCRVTVTIETDPDLLLKVCRALKSLC